VVKKRKQQKSESESEEEEEQAPPKHKPKNEEVKQPSNGKAQGLKLPSANALKKTNTLSNITSSSNTTNDNGLGGKSRNAGGATGGSNTQQNIVDLLDIGFDSQPQPAHTNQSNNVNNGGD
jgi:hypothetical protein